MKTESKPPRLSKLYRRLLQFTKNIQAERYTRKDMMKQILDSEKNIKAGKIRSSRFNVRES